MGYLLPKLYEVPLSTKVGTLHNFEIVALLHEFNKGIHKFVFDLPTCSQIDYSTNLHQHKIKTSLHSLNPTATAPFVL